MSELFIGSALVTIDGRGELALPDAFCIAIQARHARDELFVAQDDGSACVVVCDQTGVSARAAQAMALSGGEDEGGVLRRAFAFAAPSRMDGRGRIAIAPWVRPCRGHRRRALLVGMGQYFEIWDLDEVLDHGPRDLVLLAYRHLNATVSKEDVHDASMQPVRSRRSSRRTGKPGIPVQPVPAMPPRSDPVRGITGC